MKVADPLMIYRPVGNTLPYGCSCIREYLCCGQDRPSTGSERRRPDPGRHMINESEPCFARSFTMCSAKCGPRILAWPVLSFRLSGNRPGTQSGANRCPPRVIFTRKRIRQRFCEDPARQMPDPESPVQYGHKDTIRRLPSCPAPLRTHPDWTVRDSFSAHRFQDWTGRSPPH